MLAPHYSRMSIGGYREQLEEALDGRAELLFVERWGDEPGFVELLAERVARRRDATSSSRRTRCPRASSTRAIPTRSSCSRRRALVAERQALRTGRSRTRASRPTGEPWLGPDILDHLGDAPRARRGTRARLSRRVRRRPSRDPLGHRHRGRRPGRRAGLDLARIEMPNADPGLRPRAGGDWCGARSGYRRGHDARRGAGGAGLAPLPRRADRGADAQGARARARPRPADGRLGAPGRVVRDRAGRGGRASSAATARARRRCCGSSPGSSSRRADPRRGRRPRRARCSSSAPASTPTSAGARTCS